MRRGVFAFVLAVGCGDDGSAGETSETSATSETGETGSETTTGGGMQGCDGSMLRALPDDLAARGPWPVGVRTATVDGLTVEVWYPATPGSEADQDQVQYDLRDFLPDSERDKIADEDNIWQVCDCYRDIALDDAFGPYPLLVFVHGTASFRSASWPQMVHLASRGFVVAAADHPGLKLGDLLGIACGQGMVPQDLPGDIDRMLTAFGSPAGDLAFLGDRVDATRAGLSGHSAGGQAIANQGGVAKVLIPMAAGGTQMGSLLESSLVFGGVEDSVVDYSAQVDGYDASPTPKRLVGIANTGHLPFTEVCSLENAAGVDMLQLAIDSGICGAAFAGGLFQCDDNFIPDADAWTIIDHAMAGVLEHTLQCIDRSAALAATADLPNVAEYREDL